jgi:hypothetical protein
MPGTRFCQSVDAARNHQLQSLPQEVTVHRNRPYERKETH